MKDALSMPVGLARTARRYGRPRRLHVETALDRGLEEIFRFFSDARNLRRITPPQMGFEILGSEPAEIEEGTRIDYRIRLAGLPVRWQTRIAEWNPPESFVDEQIRGPYRLWVHRHSFRSRGPSDVLMTDDVWYQLPLWPFSEVAAPLVRAQLRHIFEYRAERIRELLGKDDGAR